MFVRAAGILTFLVAVGLAWEQFGPGTSTVSSDQPGAQLPFFVDADRFGALIMMPDQTLRAQTRQTVVWEDRDMGARFAIACQRKCPDAVASGSFSTVQQPAIWRSGTQRLEGAPEAADVTILQADSVNSFIGLRETPDFSELIISSNAKVIFRRKVPIAVPRLTLSPDRTFLTVGLRGDDGRASTMLFARSDHWRFLGALPEGTESACASPTGRILLRDTTVVIERSASASVTLSLDDVGYCQIGTTGSLLARFSDGSAGSKTELMFVDVAGKIAWRYTISRLAIPTMSQEGVVAVVEEREAVVLRSPSEVVARIPGAVDVRFTGTTLVSLDSKGRATWHR